MLKLKLIKGAECADKVSVEMTVPEGATRFVIGRDPAVNWPFADRTLALSARHCEIAASARGPVLRDLSTNGTFVNGSKSRLLRDHLLHDGDLIEFGPYTVLVQGAPPRVAAGAPGSDGAEAAQDVDLPITRSPGVEDTAPQRGGDPAAMLARGVRAQPPVREGLTEFLRSAPKADDASVEMTRIRPAAKTPASPTAAPTASPTTSPATSPTTPPAAPAAARPPTPMPVPAAGAVPLTPAAAVPSLPPASASAPFTALQAEGSAQTAVVAAAAVAALHRLFDLQSQARRQLGVRAPTLQALRDASLLRRATSAAAGLQALQADGCDAAGQLQRSADELVAHQNNLLAAFRAAVERLGEDLSPASLMTMMGEVPAPDTATKARLWDLYTDVWRGLGLEAGRSWTAGFVETALARLAEAYDDRTRS